MVVVAMLVTSAGAPTAGDFPGQRAPSLSSGTPGLLRGLQIGGYGEDRELKGTVSQRASLASTQ